MKKHCYLWLILIILTGLHAVRGQPVTFPDAGLEAVVREAIPKPSGTITVADMLTLTNLVVASGRGIEDLAGLETARNLWRLELGWNPITSHTALASLTNLLLLSISANDNPDISFVAALKKLRELNLPNNGIKDISPLAGLTDLQRLYLNYNAVTNPAALSALTNLVELVLDFNNVSNLSFVVPLRKLERLSLNNNQVSDLSPLASQTNLLYLNLNWNGVTNPAVLTTLTCLRELTLCGNNLIQVPFLSGLTNLTGLDLAYTSLADMSPLTNLARLEWLNVGENGLAQLPDLSALSNLRTFMMAGNQITDLTPVTRLPGVWDLHLQRNPFEDLSPLTHCPHLRVLLFYDNHTITNLSVLGAVTNLETLYLGHMYFSDLQQIDFLAGLAGLRGLDLSENYLTDLSPLTNYPSLSWLGLAANRLQHIGPLRNLPTLDYVNLSANYLDLNPASAAWSVITELQDHGVYVEYNAQQVAPASPRILRQPANRSAFAGDPVTFTVLLENNGGWPEFRWQKDGVDLENDARYDGVDSDQLILYAVTAAEAGHYRVRIWRDWVETYSAAAELRVVTNVAFADPNLEQAVRDELGIPVQPLTPADLAGLSVLSAGYRGITNLAGLEAAAYLTSLDLSGNPYLDDFAALTYLSSLNELAINDAGRDTLDWVANLPTLNLLWAGENFLEDLSPLRALTDLISLDVAGNQLTNIDPLLDLPALGSVNLSLNRLDTDANSAAWNVITNLQARGVTVDYDPQYDAPAPPLITSQPASVVAYLGDNVSFHVEASGSPNYWWLKNGANLCDTERIGGTRDDTLYLDNVQASDTASYRVRIWDEYGVTNSRTVTLRVITQVAFADPRLEQVVRDHLGIPTRPLVPADVAPLTWLNAWNRGITNLSGIESLANLDMLNLDSNPGLTDLAPLLQLPRLTRLNLNNCGVRDLAFVAALPPLTELHVWGGRFTDLAPLLSQTGLQWLNLGNNPGLADFTVLDHLTEIQYLWLDSVGLTNLAFVGYMPQLVELNLWNNAVSDLTPLAAVPQLVRLNVGANQLTDLSFVGNLPGLERLEVSENPISDLTPLIGLTHLTQLGIGATLATNLAPVATLTNLTELSVRGLGLAHNLSFLAPLTRLQWLGLEDNGISALPAYPSLDRLIGLNLSGNPLADLASIVARTNLSHLYLNNTGLSDLSALAGHTNLNNLGLADNQLTDLSPLATLPHLRWVSLWNNQVQNLAAFAGLTNLDYVDLRYNWLNTNSGSAAMTIIGLLQGRGAFVEYEPQNLSPGEVVLRAPAWLGGNQFRFTIDGPPGALLEIWRSTDWNHWDSLGFVTNNTGTTVFTDSAAPASRAFYRAQLP